MTTRRSLLTGCVLLLLILPSVAHATITTTATSVTYTGDGVLTSFPITFAFGQPVDIHLTVAGVVKTYGADFTVTKAIGAAGGTLVTVLPPANAAAVVISRTTPKVQGVHYVPNAAFPASSTEGALDRLTLMVQEGVPGPAGPAGPPGGLLGSNQESGFSGDVCSQCPAWATKSVYLDASNYASNARAALYVNVKQNAGSAGLHYKSGIVVDAYNPPDNGGDVSGLYVIQTGGGNAASFFTLTDNRPVGQTAYPAGGWALEVGTGNQKAAALFASGEFNANAANTQVNYLHNAGSKGVLVGPSDGVTFDARPAYEVGNLAINAPNESILYQVRLDGHGGFGAPAMDVNILRVVDGSGGGVAQLFVSAASSINGANILLGGNGGATPTKALRAQSGHFQVVNHAYDTVLLDLTDVGSLTVTGDLHVAAMTGVGASDFVCIDATNRLFRKVTACQ